MEIRNIKQVLERVNNEWRVVNGSKGAPKAHLKGLFTTHDSIFTYKKAFTLAEVLITLGIIGVVGALTMPTLITKHQKQATVTQLKKIYSEMSQAIQKAEVEYGTLEQWDIPAFDFNDNTLEQDRYFGEHYLFPYLKTIKKCIPTSNECWADSIYDINNQERNVYSTNRNSTAVSFITTSGYSVYYWLHGAGNGMWYIVDINGPHKKPNKIGRDIFAFIIDWGTGWKKTGYYPAGLHQSPTPTRDELINGSENILEPQYLCSKDNKSYGASGYFCTGVIALDGWKISDDYPW